MSVNIIKNCFVAFREIWMNTILAFISSKLPWISAKQKEIAAELVEPEKIATRSLVEPEKPGDPLSNLKIVRKKEIPEWAEANGHQVVIDVQGVLRYQPNATVRWMLDNNILTSSGMRSYVLQGAISNEQYKQFLRDAGCSLAGFEEANAELHKMQMKKEMQRVIIKALDELEEKEADAILLDVLLAVIRAYHVPEIVGIIRMETGKTPVVDPALLRAEAASNAS